MGCRYFWFCRPESVTLLYLHREKAAINPKFHVICLSNTYSSLTLFKRSTSYETFPAMITGNIYSLRCVLPYPQSTSNPCERQSRQREQWEQRHTGLSCPRMFAELFGWIGRCEERSEDRRCECSEDTCWEEI